MKQDLFLNAKNSVIRFITDTIKEIKADPENFPLGDLDLRFINIDAHSNLAAFEEQHYLGLRSFSIALDEKFVEVSWEFAVATWQDKEMELHDKIMNLLVSKCYVTNSFNLLNYKNEKIGVGTFVGITEVPPVHKSTTRAIQYMLVEALLDETIQKN